ncbi:MAG: glutamate-1-semialdehyde 2,1-aminomutase [Tepidisphaeraceae bacterium]
MPNRKKRLLVHSQRAFEKACRVMPGGVSSPVRAFKAVGGTPIFVREAQGCVIKDIDGNAYIDYVASYGPLIVGHAHERVVAGLAKAIGRGTSYGAPTELETQLAGEIIEAMPAIEMVRFVSSGTEAVMSAIRLARAATGREKIVKCIGCYHGHSDALLVQAGSGALTLGVPSSPGVPKSVTAGTVLAAYNDLQAAEKIFAEQGGELACFIVEPVAGNMGVVPPAAGYLQGLRQLCTKHGAILLFDEVMTGFRVARGGAQGMYNVKPDLTCLGKIIGGGLPVGAYGGPKAIMQQVSPSGSVYQAGTLSGNPLALTAGLETLQILKEPGVYEMLEERGAALAAGLRTAAEEAGVPLVVNRVGSMLTPFFLKKGTSVSNFAEATACDTDAYAKFFHAMLDEGVFLAPSQFEAMFVGLAHGREYIDQTITAAKKALAAIGQPRGKRK